MIRRAFLFVLLLGMPLGAQAAIRLPADAPEPVRWAASGLEDELRLHGLAAADADVMVEVGHAADPEAQAFNLSRKGAAITVKGGGAVGAMYGLFELTEQLHRSPAKDWAALAASVAPTDQHPFVAIRADNMFIHLRPLLINDVAMWKQYIDMLAHDRYNLLDLHGAYDLETTGFPDLYPLLVQVADYPAAGIAPEQKAKNLADLKAIIAYAESHGVHVALMNYSVAEALPPGAPRRKPSDPQIAGVPNDRLADYTAKATAELIRQLPDLYMLGFRVGETGQPASFFQDAYLRGFQLAHRPDLRLYTRSWLTTKDQLEPIAKAAQPGKFDIEIKYNGEHLGLPYHAMQERFGTYSYEHYLDVPADYGIIWQVRAAGTHHYWAWENTDFIRRTVGTFRLGHARGFTLEPPGAYISVDPRDFYRSAADQSVYDYEWKKQWAWYFAWGRLGYNPDLPESVITNAFKDHFGDTAGLPIYSALQDASKIVPLVYAYRFIGADQRDYSPETETGNSDNNSIVGSRTPIPPGLLQYAMDRPEDERSFIPIDAWVQNNIDGVPDGRLGPLAVSKSLGDASQATLSDIAAVPEPSGHAADEWRLLRTDLTAAADLGQYHADRILALTYIDHGLRTNARDDVDRGAALLASSRAAWGRLAVAADAVYKVLQNPLRRQRDFTWGEEMPKLEALDASLETLWNARAKGAHHAPLRIAASDDGSSAGLSLTATPGYAIAFSRKSVAFHVKAAATGGLSRVVLWWKPLPSDARWRAQEMVETVQGQYLAEVPFTREGLMYMVELQDTAGNARNFPLEQKQTPYWVIPASIK
jgi:hypothetical protein